MDSSLHIKNVKQFLLVDEYKVSTQGLVIVTM